MYVHSHTHTHTDLWLHVCVYLVEDQFAAASAQLCAVLMAVCMYKCVFVCVCVRSSYYIHTHNNVIYNNLLPLCSPLTTHAFYTFIYFIVFVFFYYMFLAYSVALRGSFVWWWQQQQRPRHRHRAHICCLLKQAVSACRMSLLVVTNANRVPLSQNVSHVPGLIQSWLARDPARHPHPHTLCVYACVLQYSFGFFGDRAEPSQPPCIFSLQLFRFPFGPSVLLLH